MAYASGGYTLKNIGIFFDLHYSRVSRIISKAKDKTLPDILSCVRAGPVCYYSFLEFEISGRERLE
ncbi:MAG: hypothetical protein ACJAUP_003818 [Cellvibrionaceae bacterium]|jgi:hypothetical protein